jgi:hypothetical protein
VKFQGNNLIVAGHKVNLLLLGVIATIAAAVIVVRGRQAQQSVSAGATVPSATDQAIGALQSDLSSLQGSVQQLQTMGQASQATSSAPTPAGQFTTVTPWPSQNSTLWGIAQASGVSLAQVESLNPWIHQQRGTWDLIYSGENIRVR